MEARKLSWWCFLWPGLVQIWRGRELDGLVRAVVFALFLNVGVFSSLVWAGWVAPGVRQAVWWAAAVFWAGSLVESVWWLARRRGRPSAADEQQYREALVAVAGGRWEEAEQRLQALLRACPGDADAALLMAVTAFHRGDAPRAHLYLERCRALGGQKWAWETRHLAEVVFAPQEGVEQEGVSID